MKKFVLLNVALLLQAIVPSMEAAAAVLPQSQRLFAASMNGYAAEVAQLIAAGAVVNQANKHGRTPLYIASKNGLDKVVELLLENGAVINMTDKHGQTPLYIASYKGRVGVVEKLIDAGANVNRATQNGATPLLYASYKGHVEVVAKLIHASADLNKAPTSGFFSGSTPLFVASQKGHEGVVGLLLDKGAAVDQADEDGFTPLYAASYKGHVGVVQQLITAGATVDEANEHGETPLYIASEKGHVGVVEALLKVENIKVNLARNDGVTPLYIASENGHIGVVQLLLKKAEIKVNQANRLGVTPLFIASKNGHKGVVEQLIAGKADVNKAAKDGRTPLYVASYYGHVEVVRLLLEKVADVNEVDKYGETPLYIASYKGHVGVVKVLLGANADVNQANQNGATPLLIASWKGHDKVVEQLIAAGADVDQANRGGGTPLIIASENGHVRVVEQLITAGADVNQATRHRYTPLMGAARGGSLGLVTLLLTHGANPNTLSSKGETPLVFAVRSGNSDVVGILLRNGADPNFGMIKHKDRMTTTPLITASTNGLIDIVKLLLKGGATIDATGGNLDYKTAVEFAIEKGHIDIVDLLIKDEDVDESGPQDDDYAEDGDVDQYAYYNPDDYRYDYDRFAQPVIDDDSKISKYKQSALIVAIKSGHIDIVKLILGKGADPNKANHNEDLPLVSAASLGGEKELSNEKVLLLKKTSFKIIEILLQHGADPNKIGTNTNHDWNIDGFMPLTSLMAAIYTKNIDAMNLLLKSEANPNLKTTERISAVQFAIEGRHIESLPILFQYGADFNHLKTAVKSSCVACIKILFEQGATVSNNDISQIFDISHPVEQRNILELFLLQGISVDMVLEERDMLSLLQVACLSGYIETVELLIEYKANTSFMRSGSTPLELAAEYGHTEVVEILLKAVQSADTQVNITNALYKAAEKGNTQIAKILLNLISVEIPRKVGNALKCAAINGHTPIVKIILEGSFVRSILQIKDDISKAFVRSASKGHIDVVEVLLKTVDGFYTRGDASLRTTMRRLIGKSLAMATQNGCFEVVKLILKSEPFAVNIPNDLGKTALMYAASNGRCDLMEVLIDAGADINAKDSHGMTPLVYAIKDKPPRWPVIDLLLKAGANLTPEGITPWVHAKLSIHPEARDIANRLAKAFHDKTGTYTVTNPDKMGSSMSTPSACPICLEQILEEGCILDCGHVLCKDCFGPYNRMQAQRHPVYGIRPAKCPICRHEYAPRRIGKYMWGEAMHAQARKIQRMAREKLLRKKMALRRSEISMA